MRSVSELQYGICGMESFCHGIYALFMRHTQKAKNSSPEKSAQVPGFKAGDKQAIQQEDSPTRLRVKVGPPEQLWSHAKWLALADQALLE